MLKRQLGDEEDGYGMQPSLALDGPPGTSQLRWGGMGRSSLLSGCGDGDGVCWDAPGMMGWPPNSVG